MAEDISQGADGGGHSKTLTSWKPGAGHLYCTAELSSPEPGAAGSGGGLGRARWLMIKKNTPVSIKAPSATRKNRRSGLRFRRRRYLPWPASLVGLVTAGLVKASGLLLQ